MDPRAQFCHNPGCPARGQAGLGNIRIHSRAERRYRCTTCDRTFAATRDTPFYRLKKPTELVTIVLTLLCHGCPLQAIVAAFGLDERTVASWQDRAGRHGQRGCGKFSWQRTRRQRREETAFLGMRLHNTPKSVNRLPYPLYRKN